MSDGSEPAFPVEINDFIFTESEELEDLLNDIPQP
jgi:hypothetical protein